MHSTRQVFVFVIALTLVVSATLSGLYFLTKDRALKNEAVFNKRSVLKAAADFLPQPLDEMSNDDVLAIFENDMDKVVVDVAGNVIDGVVADDIDMAQEKKKPESEMHLPLFIYKGGAENIYLFSVRGSGLWDEIWGTVAVKSDMNTIAGASFDHVGETPGLGAEIKDNPAFPAQFKGKQLFNDGKYTSVKVIKSAIKNPTYEVNGVSGATVTCDGVGEMLERGIRYYLPYLDKIKG